LIEKFPCNSKEELHARESHYCQAIECVNKNKNQGLIYALGGQKEYTKQYQEQHKEKIKQYYIDMKKQSKQYNINNKEHIKKQKNNIWSNI
jgi:hypothetical protein